MLLSCFRTLSLVFPSRTKPHAAIGFSGCAHSLSTIYLTHTLFHTSCLCYFLVCVSGQTTRPRPLFVAFSR
ncbi:unnamed protein product [Ectocarpus sp. 4 AP-2014]